MFFLSVHHLIPRNQIFGLYEANPYSESTFKFFNDSNIFDKAVFCLGVKQRMLVNYECSSGYNKVEFLKC